MGLFRRQSIVLSITFISLFLLSFIQPTSPQTNQPIRFIFHAFLITLRNELILQQDHPLKNNKEITSTILNLSSSFNEILKAYSLKSIDVPREIWRAFTNVCTSFDGCRDVSIKELMLLHARVESLLTIINKRIAIDGLHKASFDYGDIYGFARAMERVLAHEGCADLFFSAGKTLRKTLNNESWFTVKKGVALASLAGIAGLGWYFREDIKEFVDYNLLYPSYKSGDLLFEKRIDKVAQIDKPKDASKPQERPMVEILTDTYVKQLSKEWFTDRSEPEPIKVKKLVQTLEKVKPADIIAILASGKGIPVSPIVLKALCKQYIRNAVKQKTEKLKILDDLKLFSPQAKERIIKDYYLFTVEHLIDENVDTTMHDALEHAFFNEEINQKRLMNAYDALHGLTFILLQLRQTKLNRSERVSFAVEYIPKMQINPLIMGDVVYTAIAKEIGCPEPIKTAFVQKYAHFLQTNEITQEQFDKDFGKDRQETRDQIGYQYFKLTKKFLHNAGQFSLTELIEGGVKIELATINGHPVLDLKGMPVRNLEGLENIPGIQNKPHVLIINSVLTEITAKTAHSLKNMQVIFTNEGMVKTLTAKDSLLPIELTQISPVLDEIVKSELSRQSNAKPYVVVKWDGDDYGYLQKALPTLNEIAVYLKGNNQVVSEQTLRAIAKGLKIQKEEAVEVLFVAEKLKLLGDFLKILAENYAMLLLCGKVKKDGLFNALSTQTKQMINDAYNNPVAMLIFQHKKK